MKTNKAFILFATAAAYGRLIGLALAQDNIQFEAQSGKITAPFTLTGNYISQAISTEVTNGGRAVYSFTLTNSGTYVIKAKVNAPNNQSNSFYISVDAEPQEPSVIWDIPVTTGFNERFVLCRGIEPPKIGRFVPQVFNLSNGDHQLIIVGKTADTKLAQISVMKNNRLEPPQPPQLLSVIAN